MIRFFSTEIKKTVGFSILALATLTSLTARADDISRILPLQTHAAFFSSETKQKTPLDPQVFVAAPTAPAATGPQGIEHIAGVRNALISDMPELPIMNAMGKSLDMTLGAWLAAQGDVVLTNMPNGTQKITLILTHLFPHGVYSVFENHFDQKPVGFTPLDGNGTANKFVSDGEGKANVTIISPLPLTHDNAVLVIYHSDGKTHAKLRGDIGVDAHHQLIVRP
ncbi:hypothetical protein QN379_16150 [Glaciimonas sp. Gout2]|uniref:hypothetical protein n=2 Tax=Glaciimonas TaxID=1229970 RepID=UPI002AB4D2BA|nr:MULTISPECIES: hypothetical protein [unclassified Glaciimonas]MDY7548339.1 hypothetical protein [Glaciimonas sp. CA11.2]MEB0010511.1 hypothetical protein [Glaciimonas sp. Cout2]MEB0083539.1 hypothetical protein [Glaciimonas sp. Gout2]